MGPLSQEELNVIEQEVHKHGMDACCPEDTLRLVAEIRRLWKQIDLWPLAIDLSHDVSVCGVECEYPGYPEELPVSHWLDRARQKKDEIQKLK